MSYFLEDEAKRREKRRIDSELWSMKQEEERVSLRLRRDLESIREASLTYEDLQNELEPLIKRLEALEQFLKTKQSELLKAIMAEVKM